MPLAEHTVMTNHLESDRRAFLQQGSIAALTLLVPSWALTACSADDQDAGTTPKNAAWEARASELIARSVVLYNTRAPGKWAGKEGTHTPVASFAAGMVTITTPHPMTPEHYVTTHFVKNQDGVVVGLKEFQPTDIKAETTFTLPPGTTQITIFSNCNLHDLWDLSGTAA